MCFLILFIPNPDSHTCFTVCLLLISTNLSSCFIPPTSSHVFNTDSVRNSSPNSSSYVLDWVAAIASLTFHLFTILVSFLSHHLIHGCLSCVVVFFKILTCVVFSAILWSLIPFPHRCWGGEHYFPNDSCFSVFSTPDELFYL